MFCKNCGNQIADGTTFCGVCGAKIAQNSDVQVDTEPMQDHAVNNEAVNNAPVAEQTYEQPYEQVHEQAHFAEAQAPVAENPVAPAPIKKKFPKKLLYIGAPIIAVALVVALCFNTIAGFCVKTFGSNASYFAYVEAKSIGNYSDTLTKMYANSGLGGDAATEGAFEGELAIELGDSLIELLSKNFSRMLGNMELDWLKNIKLVFDADATAEKSSGSIAVVLGEQTIITLEYIIDSEKKTVYFRAKELNEKYISIEVPDSLSSGMSLMSTTSARVSAMAMANNPFEMITELSEYLPTDDQLNELLERYIKIIFDQITDDDVTEESGEIEAGGVTESCTILEIKVTEKLLLNIAKAILVEAEKDEELIAILERIQEGAEEVADASDFNIADEFTEAVSDGLEEVSEDLEELDGNGQEFFALTDYVNGSHEVIGREIGVILTDDSYSGTEKVLSILSAEDGSDVGYEITIGEDKAVSFSGKGTKSGNAVTGEYTLKVDGDKYFIVRLEDFASDIIGGEMTGSIILELGDAAIDAMGREASSYISALNPSLKLDFDINSNKAFFAISLLTGDDILAKFSVNGESTSVSVANIPESGNTIDYTEIDPDDFDLSTIIDNLEKAGVPDDIISMLEMVS